MSTRYELHDYFKFRVPNYQFTPAFKKGRWTGYIHLFNPIKPLFHIGILNKLETFCVDNNYELVYEDKVSNIDITDEQIIKFIDSLDIHSNGNKLTVKDYQYAAAIEGIKNQRRVILSSTGSGKSLIIYTLVMYALSRNKPVLLICPSTSLVEQMSSDFIDYASNIPFDFDKITHKIHSGATKTSTKPLCISTWQSLQNVDPEWFDRFSCVIVDEVHGSKANVLRSILENCVNADMRFGLTGSLDDSKVHELMIQSLFGKIVRVSSTKDLIEKGHLSDIHIKAIKLNYSKDTNEVMKKSQYAKEIAFLISHNKRNKFIRNLALSLTGNTLILYNYVEKHGDILYEMIKEKAGDRKVFYIHGGVDAEDRETVREIMEKETDCIILASFGTMGTGTNLKKLHNIIFSSPTKSVIRVLQSLGRGLRKAEGKHKVDLYDIGDMLVTTKSKNHTFNHFIERLQIYTNESFEYKLVEVQLEK